eukprot:SAG31_NODE_2115_length_6416_cov_20.056989_4_plen_132_part_00
MLRFLRRPVQLAPQNDDLREGLKFVLKQLPRVDRVWLAEEIRKLEDRLFEATESNSDDENELPDHNSMPSGVERDDVRKEEANVNTLAPSTVNEKQQLGYSHGQEHGNETRGHGALLETMEMLRSKVSTGQ